MHVFYCIIAVVVDNEAVQTCDEEITYADPTFFKRNKQKPVSPFFCVAVLYDDDTHIIQILI